MARGKQCRRHGWFFSRSSSFFARLVASIGGSRTKNRRRYRFKKF